MATIYIFTNIQDGKTYIGKTERSFNVRLSQHLWDAKGRSNFVFHKALRKYGLDNFHTECLEVSDKHVDLWEKHLIKRWNSRAPHGYNMTDGGDGRSGYTASEETRRKISEAHKGNKYWLGKKTYPSK